MQIMSLGSGSAGQLMPLGTPRQASSRHPQAPAIRWPGAALPKSLSVRPMEITGPTAHAPPYPRAQPADTRALSLTPITMVSKQASGSILWRLQPLQAAPSPWSPGQTAPSPCRAGENLLARERAQRSLSLAEPAFPAVGSVQGHALGTGLCEPCRAPPDQDCTRSLWLLKRLE